MKGFLYYLKIKKRFEAKDYRNVIVMVVKNPTICIDDEHTPFTKKMEILWTKIDVFHFYDPWLWLLLNTVFFVIFLMKFIRTKIYEFKVLTALQLSGILYTLFMFPVFQIDRDFRYTYWNVFVFVIGIVFYLDKARSAGKVEQE